MTIEPVSDWATDFDIADPDYETNPYPIWDELRQGCPVAHTERRGGAHLPTRYDDVAAVAYDTEHFTSRDVGVIPPVEGSNPLVAPPITSDPPFHTEARRLLLPFFSPKAVDDLEPKTQAICEQLIAAIKDSGEPTADAADQYAQHIPVRVISHLIGIPEEDEATFLDWAIRIFQGAATEPEDSREATREILRYFGEHVERLRQERGNDLVSYLIDAEMDGSPLTDKHILGTCFLLLMAGIDTTWSGIGSSLWHLATHHDDRDRLVNNPELMPTAIEEFLRAYSPVTMARIATEDTEVGGCPVHAGDRVLLNFPSGNRDPQKFDRPDEVLIDRERNRHFAFGIGIHRCIGSNLARMEMRVAIETWLRHFPQFALTEGVEVRWGGAQVRGPRAVPVDLNQ